MKDKNKCIEKICNNCSLYNCKQDYRYTQCIKVQIIYNINITPYCLMKIKTNKRYPKYKEGNGDNK